MTIYKNMWRTMQVIESSHMSAWQPLLKISSLAARAVAGLVCRLTHQMAALNGRRAAHQGWLLAMIVSLSALASGSAFAVTPQISAGSAHSLFLRSDGSIWGAGYNSSGALGDGTTTDRITPVQVMSGVVAISAGNTYSLFLKTDGSVWATGSNGSGQLGDGTTTDRSTPVQVMSGVVAIAAGQSHSLFLKTDGTVWATGYNFYGQFGNGTTTNRSTPVQVMSGVAAVAAGVGNSFFLKTDGSVWATGYNFYGQLGDGSTTSRSTPVQVMSGVAAVAAGSSHSLFLKTDGSVWATGYNFYGQFGNGTTSSRSTPVQVMSEVAAIAAGVDNSLFLKTDGSVWATGFNQFGKLGNGRTTSQHTPVQVMSGGAAISAGQSHSLFLKTDGSVWATGANFYGQQGDCTTTFRSTPSISLWGLIGSTAQTITFPAIADQLMSSPTVSLTGDTGATTSSGLAITYFVVSGPATLNGSTLTLTGAGTVTVRAIQLGDPDYAAASSVERSFTVSRVAQTITFPSIANQLTTSPSVSLTGAAAATSSSGLPITYSVVSGLATVSGTTLTLTGASTVIVRAAQAGDATYTAAISVDQSFTVSRVAGPQISASSHSLFLKTDGSVWGSGSNSSGQLGDGTTTDRSTPVLVMSGVAAVAAGSSHSLFLKTDGSVWATGNNSDGQFGNGTTTLWSPPVMVISGVAAIAAGYNNSLFLKTDGSVWATGYNREGQLGNGTTTSRSTPVQVMSGVAAVAARRSSHSLFLKTDGSAWATGANFNGQLGDGTTTDRSTPVQVMSGVVAIAAGQSHSLFLKTDGSVWATGYNFNGQLGNGTTTSRSTPVQVMSGVAAIAAGLSHSLFLKSDGSVWATGFNLTGQLGDGTTTSRNTPVQVISGVEAITAGDGHSFFLKTDGSVWATGANFNGQLGDGTTTSQTTPIVIIRVAQTITFPSIANQLTTSPSVSLTGAAAATSSSGLPMTYSVVSGLATVNGTILTLTGAGPVTVRATQAGNATYAAASVDQSFTVSRAAGPQISAGDSHSLYLKNDGSVWASGYNAAGMLGDGTTTDRTTPVQVMSGGALISAGGGQSLFLKSDGSVWASGRNNIGQLGDGTTTDRITPVQVMSGVVSISAGLAHSLFLKNDGSAWATGLNSPGSFGTGAGQLGDGTTTDRITPVQVMSGVAAIAAGGYHSLFLKSDGSVWATGGNYCGQLGDGTKADRSTPVRVMSGVAAVAAGNKYSLFLKSDGSVWASGINLNGQFGDGTTTDSSTPVQVMSGVEALSAGWSHSLFLKTDGSVWATGGNQYGQLGDGTTTSRSTTVQVMSGVAAIAAGSWHSLFLKSDGSVWASGRNLYGQLGDGTTNARSTPATRLWVIIGSTAQTITFPAIADQLMSSPTLFLTGAAAATTTSGLTIEYSVVSGPATVSGTTLTLTGEGTVTVRATQLGDPNYAAAISVDQSFTVSRIAQAITFPVIADQIMSSPTVALTGTSAATSSSGLPITYSVVSGPATVIGTTLMLTGGGTVTVRAAQAGDLTYAAASSVDQSFKVNRAEQTITFPALTTQLFSSALSVSLSASSTSGLPILYSVDSGPATVSGSTLSVTGVGTITLRASQAGNATYLPATDVTTTLTITPNAATPANLALSQIWFYDSAATNSVVGQVSATDADAGDALTYTLVSGTGATDNAKFTLVGASLRTAATFAYETQHSASIRVRASDGAGQFVEQSFTVVIIDATPFVRFTAKGLFIEAPCYINAVFQLSDQAGQGVNLPRNFIDQNDGLFGVRENGSLISSTESFVQIGKLDEVPSVIKTVLLLDNSFSLGIQLAAVRAAAKSFVDLMQPNQEIAIYSFAGTPVLRQGYTRNKALLNAAIDAIPLGATTTNLYGSMYELLDAPDGTNPTRWTESASLTGITTGFLVVFTDGSDQSGLRTEAEVTALRDGQQKKVFTLGMGASIDAAALTRLGNAGYKSLALATDLSAALTDVQNSIRDYANSYYWLNYASPKRGNFTRTLSVELVGNQNTGSDKLLTTTFNSATLSDLTPGVFINRTVYKANGDVSITIAKGGSQAAIGTTLYSLYPEPQYTWSVGNAGLVSLTPVAGSNGGQLLLTAGNLDGTTSLTLTDTLNDYSLTIPLVIGTGISLPPAAPSGLTTTALSSTQLNLNWIDNAADESGFKIDRSLDGSTGWTQIATPSANATSYTDSALAVGASYFYRIKSTNANGDSALSAVAGGTTWSAVQSWLSSQGLPPGTDLTEDSDRDGLPNLLEYALGSSPSSAASAIQPLTAISASHLTLSFTRVRADIVYVVESSSNLVNWVEVTYTPVAVGQAQTVTDTVAVSGRRFMRLKVTLVP